MTETTVKFGVAALAYQLNYFVGMAFEALFAEATKMKAPQDYAEIIESRNAEKCIELIDAGGQRVLVTNMQAIHTVFKYFTDCEAVWKKLGYTPPLDIVVQKTDIDLRLQAASEYMCSIQAAIVI